MLQECSLYRPSNRHRSRKLIHLCWAELIRAGIGKSVSVRSARGNGPVHSDVQIEKPHLSGPIARRAGLGQMVVVVLAVS